jgi:hypothetical protein
MKYWANYGAAPLTPPKDELPPVPEPPARRNARDRDGEQGSAATGGQKTHGAQPVGLK